MTRLRFGFYPLDSTARYDSTLPDITIEKWYKKVGDKLKENEPILAYNTDKVSGDMVSKIAGVIIEIYAEYAADGSLWESGNAETLDDVPGGRVLYPPALGVIETEPGSHNELKPEKGKDSSDSHTDLRERVVITMAAKDLARKNRISESEILKAYPNELRIGPEKVRKLIDFKNSTKQVSDPKDNAPHDVKEAVDHGAATEPRAVPAARYLLWEAGVGLRQVSGSGPDHLIVVKDAEREIAALKQTQEKIPENVTLLKPSREWMAKRDNLEQNSAGDYVRGTTAGGGPLDRNFEEYDLNPIIRFREEAGDLFKEAFGVRLRLWAPVAFAVSRTLEKRDFWTFNGYWHIADKNDRSKDMVALYKLVNLGISYDRGKPPEIDLEKGTIGGQGLRIATLHDANKIGAKPFFVNLDSLMNNVDYDSDQADGKLHRTTLRDWTGWTFIFNNIGAARHSSGISLLTSKISAMLNMGAIRNGRCIFEIFFDHRMIDGVPTTNFMDAVYEELVNRVLPELRRICYTNKST